MKDEDLIESREIELAKALKKERECIAEMVTQAGNNCAKASKDCGCYLSFIHLAQAILARK